MNAQAHQVADTILYEGYILYPYRPSSVKNRQRWTYGAIYPRAFSVGSGGGDPWEMQTECLVTGGAQTMLSVRVRFLHLLERHGADGTPVWEEASERAIDSPRLLLADLAGAPMRIPFAYPATRQIETTADASGKVIRDQERIDGDIEIAAQPVAEGLFRLSVLIRNQTAIDGAIQDRARALHHTMISTHTLLAVLEGAFLSLIDPPEAWQHHASACRNVGTWPVLVGEPGATDCMLSAPIILYDYPQVATESPGDLFDATEIDELLTLRILTLTDEEKREVAAADDRARQLLERTEALTGEQLRQLHGAWRGLRPVGRRGNDG